jgi:spectinomycin phosphotransferase
MLEKPAIQDEKIIACLRDNYGLTITELEFLPLGYDSNAGVYRVTADDGRLYFLKVKRDTVYEASVNVPGYLKNQGIEQVVAPLPTTTGKLWGTADQFSLLLYPFVDGKVGMEVGLSDSQWIEFGAVLRKIHATRLSPELLAQVPKETFVPHANWSGIVRQLHAAVRHREYENPYEKELAAFWREKHAEIGLILDRADALGRRLQTRSLEFVLCHADIHTANLLLTPDEKLFVVDWDQPVLAPKEQDLMFVMGAAGFGVGAREEDLFFRGYGPTDIDSLPLAYYRYERIVEDVGGFGETVFLKDGTSDETKQDSLRLLFSMFAPGNGVDTAHKLDKVVFGSQ